MVVDVVIVVEIPDQAVEVEPEPEPIIFSHHTSGNGTVCNTGPLNNRSTNSGYNGSSFFSSSGGMGVNLKSVGVGGMGIGVDLEMGVIGGDGGIIVLLWLLWMIILLLLLNEEGESDPIRVLNRGFRIRGEGRVVEEGTA